MQATKDKATFVHNSNFGWERRPGGGGDGELFSLIPRGKCRTVSNRRQIISRLTKETRVFDSNLRARLIRAELRFAAFGGRIDLYDNEVLISDTAGFHGVEDVRLNIGDALQERSTRKDAGKLNYKLYSKASLKASSRGKCAANNVSSAGI